MIGTFKYCTWYINILTLIISSILFLFLNLLISHFDFQNQNAVLKAGFTVDSENQSDLKNDYFEESKIIQKTEEEKKDWYLEIPRINLNAEIAEGTSKEILDKYIGHFEESKKWTGNVCLAAHNRGYENNYFKEVKKLKEGDKINYYYSGNTREYQVIKHIIIKDTDLSCLENTEENEITLITCVENEPEYRRCVKAKEIEK